MKVIILIIMGILLAIPLLNTIGQFLLVIQNGHGAAQLAGLMMFLILLAFCVMFWRFFNEKQAVIKQINRDADTTAKAVNGAGKSVGNGFYAIGKGVRKTSLGVRWLLGGKEASKPTQTPPNI